MYCKSNALNPHLNQLRTLSLSLLPPHSAPPPLLCSPLTLHPLPFSAPPSLHPPSPSLLPPYCSITSFQEFVSFLDCYAIPDGGDDYIFAIECLLEFFTDLGVEYKREGTRAVHAHAHVWVGRLVQACICGGVARLFPSHGRRVA